MNLFPTLPGREFMANKGPTWETTVKKAANGRQIRGSLQSAPIWTFKVSYEFLRDRPPTKPELSTLWAFFNNAKGQWASWYFLDDNDNVVTNQIVGAGDGATTSFQLSRTGGAGTDFPFIEPIYGVNGTPTVTVGGVATTAFTIGQNGVLLLSSAPAAGQAVAWSGSFFFLCHFTQDDCSPSQMVKDIWSLDGIEFESILP